MIAKSSQELAAAPNRHDIPSLLEWLAEKKLTYTKDILDTRIDATASDANTLGNHVAIAQSTTRRRSVPMRRQESETLKGHYRETKIALDSEQFWAALRNPDEIVRTLDWNKLPADAMAFYRPFHFQPANQWGIYLLVGPLLAYHNQLLRRSASLKLFSSEVLMHLILFEVFNHEFFHHLVESTAVTMELLSASQGTVRPIYLLYLLRRGQDGFNHPHAPLEEALANAYAYNALSFICRVKQGFRTLSVRAYQKAIEEYWRTEPVGYREAKYYIKDGYIKGGAHLLAQLLEKPDVVNEIPLGIVSKHVMPGGFASLMSKPDIPTWLVGEEDELKLFNKLVPAPNEAYSRLFWPYNTDSIEEYFEKRIAEEKARKAAFKKAGSAASR